MGFFGYIPFYIRKNSSFIRDLPECEMSSLLLLSGSAVLPSGAGGWNAGSLLLLSASNISMERALSSFRALIWETGSTPDQKDLQKKRVIQETALHFEGRWKELSSLSLAKQKPRGDMAEVWKCMEGWRRKRAGKKTGGKGAIPVNEQSSWELT